MAHSTAHSTVSRIERLSQRRRRVLAVATLAGLPAMFVWSTFWMGTSVPNVAWGPISFVLIGMTVVGSFVLYRYVRDRADMPGRRLDEREKELRDRAWILSYQVLSAVVVAAVIVIGIAVFVLGRAVTFDASLVNAIVLSVAVLLPILPAAALAWIEPDPVEEA
jgi:O-antigen/teichoic acid export membrane protein